MDQSTSSSFNYTHPLSWLGDIIFAPKTNSSKNVTPWGQTNTKPIYNISWSNYDEDADLAIRVNETTACINYTASNTSEKVDGTIINTTFWKINYNQGFNSYSNISLWEDLVNCNASEARYHIKEFELKSCCSACVPCW